VHQYYCVTLLLVGLLEDGRMVDIKQDGVCGRSLTAIVLECVLSSRRRQGNVI